MIAIIREKKDCGRYSRFVLKAPTISQKARPGQFIMVALDEEASPFWRRPFWICRSQDDTIDILVKQNGMFSRLLCTKKRDDFVDIVGPLGKPFNTKKGDTFILVAEDYGIAPLLFLKNQLEKYSRPVELIINDAHEDTRCLGECADTRTNSIYLTLDTPDKDHYFSNALIRVVEKRKKVARFPLVCAVGPRSTMKLVLQLSRTHHFACHLFLQAPMPCGLGLCQGCFLNETKRQKLACRDGPIFDAEEIEEIQ